MHSEIALRRETMSGDAADALRTMIVEGALAEGERLNEVQLAARLGVSRTPLREAINRLAAEGSITMTPHRGAFVKPLTLAEFEPLYAMRPILDPAALEAAGLPSASRMKRLEALNRRLPEARDASQAMDVDDAWHRELIAACPNPILLDLIEQFIRRTRRYEIALMREQPQVQAAVRDHNAVMTALAAADLEGACEALRANLARGAEPLRAWLKDRAA
jgi:DNA-binding GntR family transcriptional regulator